IVVSIERVRLIQQLVKRRKELRATIGRPQLWNGFAVQPQAVLMVVLVRTAHDAQPPLFVLQVAPNQVIERVQRIELERSERVETAALPDVLIPDAERVDRLNQHSLLMPVRPDQLEKAGRQQTLRRNRIAVLVGAQADASGFGY